MANDAIGARKARDTNLRKYGPDFYKRIGRTGGQRSRGGGVTGDPKRAAEIGSRGGKNRWVNQPTKLERELAYEKPSLFKRLRSKI